MRQETNLPGRQCFGAKDTQRLTILYAIYLYLEELTAFQKESNEGFLDSVRFKIRHWN